MTIAILSREELAAAVQTWPPRVSDLEASVCAVLDEVAEGWVISRPHLLSEPPEILHAAGMRRSEFKLYVQWSNLDLWFDQTDMQDLLRAGVV